MNVERFTIPEILFRPSMIGIDQAGIAESIYNSVEALPERKIREQPHIEITHWNSVLIVVVLNL